MGFSCFVLQVHRRFAKHRKGRAKMDFPCFVLQQRRLGGRFLCLLGQRFGCRQSVVENNDSTVARGVKDGRARLVDR